MAEVLTIGGEVFVPPRDLLLQPVCDPWRTPCAEPWEADPATMFKCTRPEDHEGEHVAHGRTREGIRALARWPRKEVCDV